MKKEQVNIDLVSELVNQSSLPEIPVRSTVDLANLTLGDDNPFFITLEIANLDGESKNGLIYDQELVKSIVEQINTQPKEGIMGHLAKDRRDSEYKPSDVHWLGAVEYNNRAYAKGYIPKTAIQQREHFRILQFTGGKAATSIYGWADQEVVDKASGTWKALSFELEQLDLAPYTRAALKPTGDKSHIITSEMDETHNGGKKMDVVEIGVSELADLKKEVAEYKRNQFKNQVKGIVSETFKLETKSEDGKSALDAIQKLVTEYAGLVADTEDEVRVVVSQVGKDIESVMKLLVQALAGPKAFIQEKEKESASKFVDTPETRAAARAKFGLVE